MQLSNLPLSTWIARLRNGDEQVAHQFFHHYLKRLTRHAARQLSRHLQGKVGPDSIVQQALKSFFLKLRQGRYTFRDWTEMERLLYRMIKHKSLNAQRYHHRKVRDVGRNISFEEMQHGARENHPTDCLIEAEVISQFLDAIEKSMDQCDRKQKSVIVASLIGQANQEISEREELTIRTVQRILKKFRESFRREIYSSGEEDADSIFKLMTPQTFQKAVGMLLPKYPIEEASCNVHWIVPKGKKQNAK